MLDSIRFVQGAVAKKDYSPALTHFRIAEGRILGYNGTMALSGPVDLDLEVMPKAIPFIKAIQTCKEAISLHLAPNGRLAIRSGDFQVFVECHAEDYPEVSPQGECYPIQPGFVDALRVMAPFIGEDASRPWACGLLLRGPSAYATNNVVLVEYWLGHNFPIEVNLPRTAVAELLRIKEDPTHLQSDGGSVTFHFTGGRWLRTQPYEATWPEIVGKLLAMEGEPVSIDDAFFEAIEELVPFTDTTGRILLADGCLETHSEDTEGAKRLFPGCFWKGAFSSKYLLQLQGVARKIDFSQYPGPCKFYGDKIRGVILGMRV